jgi:hypothetical protein
VDFFSMDEVFLFLDQWVCWFLNNFLPPYRFWIIDAKCEARASGEASLSG